MCIKFIVAWFAIPFIFTFISLITLLVLSFLFIKTGAIFWGSFLGIVSAIIINYIILELCYNFIVNRKTKKNIMAILFIISLVLVGASIGFICIGVTNFNYIENSEINNEIEDVYNIEMSENLSIKYPFYNVEYIETDSKEVKIVVKHSKYYDVKIINDRGTTLQEKLGDNIENDSAIRIHLVQDDTKSMEQIRQIIKDINNKEIKDYSNYTVYVYSSKSNLEKIERNRKLYPSYQIMEK